MKRNDMLNGGFFLIYLFTKWQINYMIVMNIRNRKGFRTIIQIGGNNHEDSNARAFGH